MPLSSSASSVAKNLEGLHLFHFVYSNCSQRVRLVLEEKGLAWKSHHLDLSRIEHVTGDYQAINPKGVVPTLVHDGQVVIESNDILLYLEEKFPVPSLIPGSQSAVDDMETRIRLASDTQEDVKVLSFHLLFRQFLKFNKQELKFLEENRNNRDVTDFMQDYYENSDAWQQRVDNARQVMDETLSQLNKYLGDADWLTGDQYGLADVSWVVNAHRLVQASYLLDDYPAFYDWYRRASSRPAFDKAVTSYHPPVGES